MNIAGYVRVSSDAQTENYSIPQQKKYIENYCELKGWTLIKIYVDPGFTGANTDRPALQDLIEHLNQYDMVLVYKLDRLSRNQKDTLVLIEKFNSKNVKFASIQENFDTSTPLGMLMLGVLSAFAQLEREQIKERMALGRKGRREKGLWRAGSNVPTGYDYIDGHLVIREDEAEQVRKIFELFLSGWSIHKIRQYMSEHYTNRYGNWGQPLSIKNTLKNSLYIGMLPSKSDEKSYQGEHEPIIDKKTFEDAQRLLAAREEHLTPEQSRPYLAKHLLTGLTYCGECGGKISCEGTAKYCYYGCNKERRKSSKTKMKPKCNTPRYNYKVLDELIIGEVLKLSYDEKSIKTMVKPKKKVDHSKAIKSLERQKSRLIDLYAVGGIDMDALTLKINDISTKIENLKNDQPEEPELTYEQAVEIFRNSREILEGDSNTEAKRAILHSLIRKIVLDGDQVVIYWRFQ